MKKSQTRPPTTSYLMGMQKQREIEKALISLEKVLENHRAYIREHGRTWLKNY